MALYLGFRGLSFMIQEIIIGIIFLAAVGYVIKLFKDQFKSRNTGGCAKGCNSCSVVDLDKITPKP